MIKLHVSEAARIAADLRANKAEEALKFTIGRNNNPSKVNDTCKKIFDIFDIKTRDDLDKWSGSTRRKRLYNMIELINPVGYADLKDPNATIRGGYELVLEGYTSCKQ